MTLSQKAQAALLIFLLALTLDMGWWSLDKAYFTPDATTYLVPARHMRAGLGFTNERLEPETRRTPGYPAMVAAVEDLGGDLEDLILLQHLVRSLLAVGVFLLTERVLRSPPIAVVAGALYALDLTSVIWANRIMSETCFTALVTALFAMTLTWPSRGLACAWWSFALGFVGGSSVLVRPVALFLPLPIGLYLLLTRRTRALVPFLLMVAGFAVLPISWAWHNWNHVGVATLSSISADNLLLYRAAGALAEETVGPFDRNLPQAQEALAAAARQEGERTLGPAFEHLPHAKRARVYTRVALRVLEDHPWGALRLTARGVATTLLGGGATDLMAVTGLPPAVARAVVLSYTAPVLLAAILGWVYLFRRHGRMFWATILFVLYFVGISAGAEAYSRFRVPAMPMYAIAASAGLFFAWNRFRVSGKRSGPRVPRGGRPGLARRPTGRP